MHALEVEPTNAGEFFQPWDHLEPNPDPVAPLALFEKDLVSLNGYCGDRVGAVTEYRERHSRIPFVLPVRVWRPFEFDLSLIVPEVYLHDPAAAHIIAHFQRVARKVRERTVRAENIGCAQTRQCTRPTRCWRKIGGDLHDGTINTVRLEVQPERRAFTQQLRLSAGKRQRPAPEAYRLARRQRSRRREVWL